MFVFIVFKFYDIIYFRCLDILSLLLNSLSDYQLQNCSFAIILLSMVSEFVMATDLDKPSLISLIDLAIGNYTCIK